MLKVRSFALGGLVFAILFGGIGLSTVLGYWITESARVPTRFSTGEFDGSYNPADIRGSYRLADIEEAFGIPLDVLARAFGVSELENPGEFAASNLESMYGEQADGGEIGTDSLRLFVSLYVGLPYSPQETTRLPSAALIELDAKLATADLAALSERVISEEQLLIAAPAEVAMLSEAEIEEVAPQLAEERDGEAAVIRGNTNFGQLLDWGLTREQIEEVLGVQMGARLVVVRDFAFDNGLEYGSIRESLQLLLEGGTEPVAE